METKLKTIFVGIDPDTDRSGLAVYDAENKCLVKLCCMRFFEMLEFFQAQEPYFAEKVFCRIEAGWLHDKSNFHSRRGQSKEAGERIAKNVGANAEAGRKIGEMCEYLGFDYDLVKPLGTKIICHKTFVRMTGWKGRTNQEMRDAAMLVWEFSCKNLRNS